MLVLPFNALCDEKAASLERLLEPFSAPPRKAKRFYGGMGSATIISPDTGARHACVSVFVMRGARD